MEGIILAIAVVSLALGLIIGVTIFRVSKPREQAAPVIFQPGKSLQNDSPLTAAPYPTCIADSHGVITWANLAFHKLPGIGEAASLGSLVQGGADISITPPADVPQISELWIRTDGGSLASRRKFSCVCWPLLKNGRVTGTVVSLHETTRLSRSSSSTAQFEGQVSSYLLQLGNTLQQLSRRPDLTTALLAAVADEVHSLGHYLVTTHDLRHSDTHHNLVDLRKILDSLLPTMRGELLKVGCTLAVTLPKTLMVRGAELELMVAIQELLESAISQTERGSTLRIHASTKDNRLVLTISLAERQLPTHLKDHPLRFGHGTNTSGAERLWQVRLALARQIITRQNGFLTVASEQHGGTVYEVSFALPKLPVK